MSPGPRPHASLGPTGTPPSPRFALQLAERFFSFHGSFLCLQRPTDHTIVSTSFFRFLLGNLSFLTPLPPCQWFRAVSPEPLSGVGHSCSRMPAEPCAHSPPITPTLLLPLPGSAWGAGKDTSLLLLWALVFWHWL